MVIPSDNYILLSLINTKLRDEYSSFEELCEEEDVDLNEITSRLAQSGYIYNPHTNSFIMHP
ncbi:MAG: DUF4250 domain-containing protein [Clostridia bacterium]|nr:DUF4250 domain-containing protein [Clostridia bacterium]